MTINLNGVTVKSIKGQDPPVNDANHVYSYACNYQGSQIPNLGTGINGDLSVFNGASPSAASISYRLSRAQLSTYFSNGEWAKTGTSASIIPTVSDEYLADPTGVTIEAFVIPQGLVDDAEGTLIMIDNTAQSLSICTDGTDWYGKITGTSAAGGGFQTVTEYTDQPGVSTDDNTYQKKTRWGVPTHLMLTYANIGEFTTVRLWIDGGLILQKSSSITLSTLSRISLAGNALTSNKFLNCYVSQVRVSNINRGSSYCNSVSKRCFGM